ERGVVARRLPRRLRAQLLRMPLRLRRLRLLRDQRSAAGMQASRSARGDGAGRAQASVEIDAHLIRGSGEIDAEVAQVKREGGVRVVRSAGANQRERDLQGSRLAEQRQGAAQPERALLRRTDGDATEDDLRIERRVAAFAN